MDKITLGHGSGGRLSHELIKELFVKKFGNATLKRLEDSAVISGIKSSSLAFTTDSYVVRPLFFPGGDIGKLAVCGTVNDLSVMGAKPLCISLGLIIEEGLDFKVLEKITDSIKKAAKDAGVSIVTGDTKVVEKGSADKIFINTAGIGIMRKGINPSASKIKPGDKVILSGSIGDHSIAILSARGQLGFKASIQSDCGILSCMIEDMLKASCDIRFMRDVTRGGLAGILNEIAEAASFGIAIDEENIPVSKPTQAACELLGFDPLYLANEGKLITFVSKKDAKKILKAMKNNKMGKHSKIIGEVVRSPRGKVYLNTAIGGRRLLDMMVADQLPRIC